MKIAFYSDNFYPELSGISDSILITAKELAKRGHFINFFVPSYSKKNYDFLSLPFKEQLIDEKIKITRMFSVPYPTGTKQSRLVIPTGLRTFALKKFNPDLIHTNHIMGVGLEGLIDASFLNVPIVGTNHTPISEFVRYTPIKAKWFQKLAQKYDVWYFNHCDFVSSPSSPVLKEMQSLGFKKPSHPVSNPVEFELFEKEYDKNKLKKDLGLSDFTLIYCGRLAPEKHIDLIIRVAAQLREAIPTISVVISGTGSEENNLKELAKKLGIFDRIKFYGYIKEKEEFVRLYKASDVFLMLGTAETQSIVMMQAMASGLSVIGVKAWGLVDFINEKNGILIEPNDLDALKDRILFLYKNKEIRENLGRGGQVYVKNFAPTKIAEIWENIYLDVLKNRLKH
jgi:glycosyltransferase involved in cell wall biosynthesis